MTALTCPRGCCAPRLMPAPPVSQHVTDTALGAILIPGQVSNSMTTLVNTTAKSMAPASWRLLAAIGAVIVVLMILVFAALQLVPTTKASSGLAAIAERA